MDATNFVTNEALNEQRANIEGFFISAYQEQGCKLMDCGTIVDAQKHCSQINNITSDHARWCKFWDCVENKCWMEQDVVVIFPVGFFVSTVIRDLEAHYATIECHNDATGNADIKLLNKIIKNRFQSKLCGIQQNTWKIAKPNELIRFIVVPL